MITVTDTMGERKAPSRRERRLSASAARTTDNSRCGSRTERCALRAVPWLGDQPVPLDRVQATNASMRYQEPWAVEYHVLRAAVS